MTTRGRAHDNACRGMQRRVDGCDDTRQRGQGGARGVVMHPKMTSRGIPRFRLEAKEHGKTKYLSLIL